MHFKRLFVPNIKKCRRISKYSRHSKLLRVMSTCIKAKNKRKSTSIVLFQLFYFEQFEGFCVDYNLHVNFTITCSNS